ncbi:MAG: hypothetical protein JXB48_23630, partial [Candidatus Latescibacteria bacterium]|nr:hypothetical protein [Candidatus Latescibacterota bacterium]
MFKKAVFPKILVLILLAAVSTDSFAEKIKTKRIQYMEWGFTIELPQDWERHSQKVPDYTYYTCIAPLDSNETAPKAKINILVGPKKEEHDDDFFFEKTLFSVKGKEIDRGAITIKDPKRDIPGKWIHYYQERDGNNDVEVLSYLILEGGIVYMIICYADEDVFDTYETMFREIALSLRST